MKKIHPAILKGCLAALFLVIIFIIFPGGEKLRLMGYSMNEEQAHRFKANTNKNFIFDLVSPEQVSLIFSALKMNTIPEIEVSKCPILEYPYVIFSNKEGEEFEMGAFASRECLVIKKIGHDIAYEVTYSGEVRMADGLYYGNNQNAVGYEDLRIPGDPLIRREPKDIIDAFESICSSNPQMYIHI